MIDHIIVTVSDYARCKAFYLAALAPLGYEVIMEFGPAGGFGVAGKPDFDPQNEESSLLSARAQLDAARARLVEARSHYNRMKELIVDSAVSQAQYEQAEAMLRTAESQVESGRDR